MVQVLHQLVLDRRSKAEEVVAACSPPMVLWHSRHARSRGMQIDMLSRGSIRSSQ